jgi:hypothetical protein
VLLELAVVGVLLLDGVVGEVHLGLEVVYVELVGGCPDIAVLVPVGPIHPKEVGDQHEVPDIELPVVVKQGSIQVHLDYVGALGLLVLVFGGPSLLQYSIQLVYLVYDCYALSLVAVLPRLDYPDVPGLGLLGVPLLLLFGLLGRNSGPSFVVLYEPVVLWVFDAFPYVEGEGQSLEDT